MSDKGAVKAAAEAAEAQREARNAASLREIEAGRLPLTAVERIQRMAGRAFTSELTVGEFAALESAGLDTVGQVLGTCVYHLGWQNTGCGTWSSRYSYTAARVLNVTQRTNALAAATSRALGRMRDEATGLGADGVVGVALTFSPFEGVQGALDVQAIGTAVRVPDYRGPRPAAPFLADMTGEEVTALLRAGWVPTGIAFGFASCVRHDDWSTQYSSQRWAGNQEIPGVSELVGETRHRARAEFTKQAAHFGGQAAVVRNMSLRTWEQEPSDGHKDHLAEASVIGTSLASFRPRVAPKKTLMVLPVGGGRERALNHARRNATR